MKHRIKTTHLLALLLVAILAACQVVDGTPTMTPPATIPPTKDHRTPPPDDPLVALGMTHLTGLEISGAETDALVVNQTSTGDIVEFRDNGTVVWRLADGGLVSNLGQCIDLDADSDTSICADTDDQIDYELGGADVFVMKDFGTGTITTAATEHLLEILDSTRVVSTSTGTTNQSALNIDLGIGNSTAGTSNVYGILIDGISQDAQNTETAISLGAGWDVDLNGTTDFVMAVDTASIATWQDWTATALTDTTEYILEIADTTGIGQSGTNKLAALNIDMGIGNSTAGTNSIYGILIDTISQDTQNTENAISIGANWDNDINGTSDLELSVDDTTVLTIKDPVAAGSSDDLVDLTGTFNAMNGSDTVIGLDINLTGANHTGTSNNLYGIDLDLTTADADASEVAIELSDTDWDTGIKGAQDLENIMFPTVVSTAITYTAAAGGTGTVATIADGEVWIVHDIFVNVTTNWDATGDDVLLHIGDGGDEDGLCDLDDGELQTTDVEVTGGAAGWQCFGGADTIGAYIASGRAHIYAPSGAAETIDYLIDETSGETITAGAATIYVVYTRIQ